MKTYVISLARSRERRQYILAHTRQRKMEVELIEAVDGRTLSEEKLAEHCLMDHIKKHPEYFTPGMIGCALSHYKAYQQFIASGEDFGFFIEDDVVLPTHIHELLRSVLCTIRQREVIMLHFNPAGSTVLSTVGREPIDTESHLMYPMGETGSAMAYILSREVAQGLLRIIKPIRTSADSWEFFYKQGALDTFRVCYPARVTPSDFKSSIDYINDRSLLGRFSNTVANYRIPVLYQILRRIRRWRRFRLENTVSLTDMPSPFMPDDDHATRRSSTSH